MKQEKEQVESERQLLLEEEVGLHCPQYMPCMFAWFFMRPNLDVMLTRPASRANVYLGRMRGVSRFVTLPDIDWLTVLAADWWFAGS